MNDVDLVNCCVVVRQSLLPTAPQRRMKHAVHLAQKLGERERELKSARYVDSIRVGWTMGVWVEGGG